MANVVSGNYSDSLKGFYEKRLLMRAFPRLVHTRWAEKATINRFNTLEWRRYGALSAVTASLTESATPAEQNNPSVTPITATPLYYGAWLGYSDKMDLQAFDPVMSWMAGVLGEQCGLSVDTITRDYLVASANITKQYANGKASRVTLDAPGDNITYQDILKAVATLQTANAQAISGGVIPVVVHPHTMATLFQDPVFVEAFIHASPGQGDQPLKTGYMGRFLTCDFYVTSNSREYADGGVGSTTDVYDMLFFGKEGYGSVGVATLEPRDVDNSGPDAPMGSMTGAEQRASAVELITKELGSAGANDPLNQRGSCGWKTAFDVRTLNSAFMLSLEHVTVFSDD